jgi:hypothetical protein
MIVFGLLLTPAQAYHCYLALELVIADVDSTFTSRFQREVSRETMRVVAPFVEREWLDAYREEREAARRKGFEAQEGLGGHDGGCDGPSGRGAHSY